MASSVRRKPNAFNLWSQLQLAKRMQRESVTGLEAVSSSCGSTINSKPALSAFVVPGLGQSGFPGGGIQGREGRKQCGDESVQVCGPRDRPNSAWTDQASRLLILEA